MKKRLLLLGLLALGMCCYGQGNVSKWRKVLQAATAKHATFKTFAKHPWRTSSQLAKRAQRTFIEAHALETELDRQTALALLRRNQASSRVSPAVHMELLDDLYPDLKDILHNKYQLSNYFLAQNNRQVLKYAPQETAHLMLIQQNINHLKEARVYVPKITGREKKWLAQQIPSNTDYLLLGEVHNVPELHDYLAQLVPELRKKFGRRPIIWLTEFLPHFFTADLLKGEFREQVPVTLLDLWDTLYAYNIRVVGIENMGVFARDANLYQSLRTFKRKISMWETWEGVRIRNQFWQEQIAQTRARNPDALIIIHAGFGHLDYTLPHSLGASLRPEGNTFTVSLVPGYPSSYRSTFHKLLEEVEELAPVPCPEGGFAPVSPFDFAAQGHFPQQALKFGPGDWYITGFDVQLKIPALPGTF